MHKNTVEKPSKTEKVENGIVKRIKLCYHRAMENKRTTVKDIANTLHLSLATVSNALTGKPTVNRETKELVLTTAAQMGYQANRLAQSLARNPIEIGVVLPSFWTQHHGLFESGIQKELKRLQDYNVSGVFEHVSAQYASEEICGAVDRLVARGVRAAIVCPAFDPTYQTQLERLHEAGIPTVVLGSDVPGARRLCCVGQDAFVAGSLAGEFLNLMTEAHTRCVILIGNKDMAEHAEKVKGFVSAFASESRLAGVYETQDVPEVAALLVKKVLREIPDIGGIYVATGNSEPVCRHLQHAGLQGRIRVVATDVFLESQQFVEDGTIQGVIYQNEILQGKMAVRTLFDYLTTGKPCEERVLIYPNLVLRSNLQYYTEPDE